MSFIQQLFTSRDNNANAETFVGQQGRLWWDPITNQIYSSDGSTPGGIPLAGGGGNGSPGGSNSQVQFNQNGTFGGSANLTFDRTVGALTAVSFVGDGSALANITGANVVGVVNEATYASSAVTAITAETVTANSQPNINSLGILTELSVTGNVTADYFIGNGSLLTGISSGSSNTIFNGNSNVVIATTDGNITITANTSQPYTWTFDTTGELLLAGNILVSGNTTIKTNNDDAWISQAVGVNGFSQLYWTSNISAANPYNGNDDFAWAYVDSGGFFVTSRTVEPAKEYNWDFRGSDGALITPGKFITNPGNTNAEFSFRTQGSGSSSSDLAFGATNDGDGSHYFYASAQDTLGSVASFELNAFDEQPANAKIITYADPGPSYEWTFTGNGELILPLGTAYIGADSDRVSIYSNINDENAGLVIQSNFGTELFNESWVRITTDIAGTPRIWDFDQNGNLTVPGSITQNNYNSPNLLTARGDDSNWAYGFSSDSGANYYTQVKFFGDHSTTRGFKISDSDSGNAWLFNGNGEIAFPDATVQSTAFTGTATSATTAGTVTTNAQPNITSVGTLSSVAVTGNATSGNLITTGAVYSNYNTNTANTGSFMATGGNTKGGTGYLDFLVVQNTSGGATVPYKWLRTTSDGQLQIINSAYSQNIFNLTDTGNLTIPGQLFINGAQTTNGPAFSAYAAAILQTIPNNAQTKVLFQTEEFDTNNCYANSRFTPTAAGYYQLNAEVRLDGSSGTGEMMIILYKNGAEYKRGTNQSGTQIASNFWAMQVSSMVYANGVGDYFEIYVQQGSGSDRTVTAVDNSAITWFNGCMIRGA